MDDRIERALQRLTGLTGVRGALLIDGVAGVPVLGGVGDDMAASGVAALAAAAYRRTAAALHDSAFGALRSFQVAVAAGHVVVAGGPGDLLVAVVVEPHAPLGRVQAETIKVAEGLP